MDYSQLSDFEINKRVAVAVGVTPGSVFQVNSKNGYDPCNKPEDAWPIIESSNISINHNSVVGEWVASHGGVIYQHCRGKRPLRLAMECFLKIQDTNHA